MRNKTAIKCFCGNKRGFTIYFIFLVLLIIVFAKIFSQAVEMQNLGQMQMKIINRHGETRPLVDPRVNFILLEKSER